MTQEDLIQSLKAAQSDASFRNAQRENRRLEDLIAQTGLVLDDESISPPEPEGPGFLHTFFDTIDTPGQWVRGNVARLAGVEGYKDLGIIGAAEKGAKEDLITSDILEAKGLHTPFVERGGFADNVGQGVAGFIGDVFLDPLNYISFGGATGAKVAGKGLNKSDDIARYFGKSVDDIIQGATEANKTKFELPKNLRPGELERLQLKIGKEAGDKTDASLRLAASLVDDKKKLERMQKAGFDPDVLASFEGNIADKTAIVQRELLLGENVDPTKLFQESAIRFTDEIPFVKKGRTYDIPLVTDASKALYSTVGDLSYNARVNVGEGFKKAIAKGKETPGLNTVSTAAESIVDAAQKFPSLFSRRLAAGGAGVIESIQEHEIDRGLLMANKLEDSDFLFKPLEEKVGAERLSGIFDELSSAFEKGKRLEKRGVLDVDHDKVFAREVGRLKQKFNAEQAGLGDEVEFILNRVNEDFKRWGEIEKGEGILGDTIDGYITHMYLARPGYDSRQVLQSYADSITRGGAEGIPQFSLARTIGTLEDAETRGLVPIKDLKTIYTMRAFQHEKAVNAKRFMERLSLNYALPKDTLNRISGLVLSEQNDKARAAIRFLQENNLKVGIDELLSASEGVDLGSTGIKALAKNKSGLLDNVWGVFHHPDSKGVMSANELNRLRDMSKKFGIDDVESLPLDEAMAMVDENVAQSILHLKKLGLTKTAKNDAEWGKFITKYDELYKNYTSSRELALGRLGESQFARSGTDVLPKSLRGLINKAKGLDRFDDETRNFFNGVLPEPLIRAVNDSYDTRSILDKRARELVKAGNDPERDALLKLGKNYLKWVKWLKLGATTVFPAYHMRNAVGAQLQNAKAASTLGDALNPYRLQKVMRILHGNADFVTDLGERVTNAQLKYEMKQLGVKASWHDTIDLMQGWANTLEALGSKDAFKNLEKAKAPTKAGKLLGKAQSVFESIENFGRGNLYISLRMKGQTPQQAARITNKTMIDYARGKTAFERNYMNNIIFFYSFARGEASNTLTAMLTKPGAITSQLHFVNGVAEMLEDPNAVPLPPDIQADVETARSKDRLSRYLGRTTEGNPRLATGFGIPIEDLTRFAPLRAPRSMKINDLIDAGSESAQRALKVILNQANPVLQAPLKLAFEKNLFFDRPITDKTLRKIPQASHVIASMLGTKPDRMPKPLYDSLKAIDSGLAAALDARDNGDGTMTANPYRLIAMSVIPYLDRSFATARQLGQTEVPLRERYLQALSGVKVSEVDVDKSVAFDRKNQLKDYIEFEALPRSKSELLKARLIAEQRRASTPQ